MANKKNQSENKSRKIRKPATSWVQERRQDGSKESEIGDGATSLKARKLR